MFLDVLRRRNPAFLEAAIVLHQAGAIPANSYVLDLDAVEANARHLSAEAGPLGLKVFAMTKQIGRNPPALDALKRGGVDAFVAVDLACARPIAASGHRVGHVGHLVQIPRSEAVVTAGLRPDYWTVFGMAQAEQAAAAAGSVNRDQHVMARIHAPGDVFYQGHEGGFAASDVRRVAEALQALPHITFAGITTFPALLFDKDTKGARLTPNARTLQDAAEALRDGGLSDVEVNAPGTTSTVTLKMLAEAGATQVEPGHGLTGTTPLHAYQDLPETPAVLYLSEIAHLHGGRAYCYGGGLYVDPVFDEYQITAILARSGDQATSAPVPADLPPPAAIDYYGQLDVPDPAQVRAGDTVIFGFRCQAFVTRAYIVPVSGISSGHAVVQGVWNPLGYEAPWPDIPVDPTASRYARQPRSEEHR